MSIHWTLDEVFLILERKSIPRNHQLKENRLANLYILGFCDCTLWTVTLILKYSLFNIAKGIALRKMMQYIVYLSEWKCIICRCNFSCDSPFVYFIGLECQKVSIIYIIGKLHNLKTIFGKRVRIWQTQADDRRITCLFASKLGCMEHVWALASLRNASIIGDGAKACNRRVCVAVICVTLTSKK